MDLKNISNLVKGFFRKNLNSEESMQLKKLIENNPAAAHILEEENAVRNFMMEAQLMTVREQMKKDLNNGKSFKTLYTVLIIAVLASIGVLIAVNVPNSTNNENDNAKALTNSTKKDSTDTNTITKKNKSIVERKKTTEKPKNEKASNAAIEVNTVLAEVPKSNNNREKNLDKYLAEELPHGPPENICDQFHPTVNITKENANPENTMGSINVISNSPLLQFRIDEDLEFSNSTMFSVEPGIHTIYAKNANNCIAKVSTITILNSACYKNYTETFSPNSSQVWDIPVLKNNNYFVQIIDKQNNTVFEYQSTAENETVWNGQNKLGEVVPMGLYKAVVQYSNGEKCVYNVTVIQ